jgi:hypothetical protein
MKVGSLVRLKDFEGRSFPLWKTFERMYYEPEAGTMYPDEFAIILEICEETTFSFASGRIGLKLLSSQGITGWNNAHYFEVVK